jgi:hypothetical protein
MKSRTTWLTALIVSNSVIAIGVFGTSVAMSQTAAPRQPATNEVATDASVDRSEQSASLSAERHYNRLKRLGLDVSWDHKRLNDVVNINVEILRKAKLDEDKTEAKQNIKRAMVGYFDQDMAEREKEIVAIEARAKQLREQLEHRRTAKAEIIELQLKVIEDEANGLGLYQSSQPSGR